MGNEEERMIFCSFNFPLKTLFDKQLNNRAMNKYLIILISLAFCSLSSCAKVSTERSSPSYESDAAAQPLTPYEGPKVPVKIVRFGIPEEIVSKYPELADKRVGWGLSNRLVEGFYDTERFEFVEEKEAILKRIVGEWKLSQTGIYSEDEHPEIGVLKPPEYLIYAEVYDFSVSHSEVLIGIAMEQRNTTIIGLQIRLVNVETGGYIPASGTGEATTTAESVWVTVDVPFDQTTVGIASQKAVDAAIRNLIKRMEDKM